MRQLIIISGRSGSGKTIALHSLEDLDFYCIDNLPIVFMPLLDQAVGKEHHKVAISVDSRNIQLQPLNFDKTLKELAEYYQIIDIIYLDAREEVLLQRFSDTRRKHPLTKSNLHITLKEAIAKEHEILQFIRKAANFTLDTTKLTQHELYKLIRARANSDYNKNQIHLLLQSFGFKYGLPLDADFVFDVRALPNPYWNMELRDLNGLDQQVIDFLSNNSNVQKLFNKLLDFVIENLVGFFNQHRSYVNIALGCTGGKHRSVYLVERMAKRLLTMNINLASIQIRHRELSRNI